MRSKKWTKRLLISSITFILMVSIINYFVDPYNIYKINYFNFEKIRQTDKIRLVKAIKVREIEPCSISLGTSRAEYGYDPNHEYFSKPSYNLATSGSSMYENKLYFQLALKQGCLKKVLLVLDYRMFNNHSQKSVSDFETYFDDDINIYSILFSIDVLKDSFKTVLNRKDVNQYLDNGQRNHYKNWKNIQDKGGHLATMKKDESKYYKDFPTNYTYKDTKKKSFPDFEEIVKLSYENNIELDIIFGPSHVRQWEALDYYLGYEKWLHWKKDVVLSTNKIAKQYNKQQFRIMDFSVYHSLTAEEIPTDKNSKMKYHWESSHYKNELGVIVLDRLLDKSKYKDFGVQINLDNIDRHLDVQQKLRNKFINIDLYRKDFKIFLEN